MTPFEGPPGKPEQPVRMCPHYSGRGTVKEAGKTVTCKPCHGTGQIRSGA